MAQLLPDKERQKPLAYLLLVIVAIVFYDIFINGPLMRHLEISDQADQLRQQETRFREAIAQRDVLESELTRLRSSASQSDLFLDQENTNLASSELTTRLKDTINEHGSDKCQVLSNQNLRNLEEERFQRVTIKVRMRCEVDDLSRVLYALETSMPYLFIQNLTIYRQTTRRRVGRELVQEKMLDVRFDLSGYIKQGVAEA